MSEKNKSTTAILISLAVVLCIVGFFSKNQEKEPLKRGEDQTLITKSATDRLDAEETLYRNPGAPLSERDKFFKDLRFRVWDKFEAGDYEGAYELLRANEGKIHPDRYLYVMSNILTHWSHLYPDHVLALLEKDKPIRDTDQVIRGVGRGFAMIDSSKAFQWYEEAIQSGLIKNSSVSDYIYLTILEFHAQKDPEFVIKALNELEDMDSKLMLIGPIVKNLSHGNRSGIVEWVLDIPQGGIRKDALEHLLDHHPNTHDLVTTMMNNREKAEDHEISQVLNMLGEHDFETATQVIMTDLESNTPLLKNFISDRIIADADKVQNLINEVEDDSLRDDLIGSLSESLINSSPTSAISTAFHIKDTLSRKQAISGLISSADADNLPLLHEYFDEFDTMAPEEKAEYRLIIENRQSASQ